MNNDEAKAFYFAELVEAAGEYFKARRKVLKKGKYCSSSGMEVENGGEKVGHGSGGVTLLRAA